MKAKVCDRCGVTYTDNDREGEANCVIIANEVNGGYNYIRAFDLCDDCISSFMSFMNDVTDA